MNSLELNELIGAQDQLQWRSLKLYRRTLKSLTKKKKKNLQSYKHYQKATATRILEYEIIDLWESLNDWNSRTPSVCTHMMINLLVNWAKGERTKEETTISNFIIMMSSKLSSLWRKGSICRFRTQWLTYVNICYLGKNSLKCKCIGIK